MAPKEESGLFTEPIVRALEESWRIYVSYLLRLSNLRSDAKKRTEARENVTARTIVQDKVCLMYLFGELVSSQDILYVSEIVDALHGQEKIFKDIMYLAINLRELVQVSKSAVEALAQLSWCWRDRLVLFEVPEKFELARLGFPAFRILRNLRAVRAHFGVNVQLLRKAS